MSSTLLVVGEDLDFLSIVSTFLSSRFLVLTASTPAQALRLVRTCKVDLVLSNLDLRDPHGLELAFLLRRELPLALPILTMTHNNLRRLDEHDRARIEGMANVFGPIENSGDLSELRRQVEATLRHATIEESAFGPSATGPAWGI